MRQAAGLRRLITVGLMQKQGGLASLFCFGRRCLWPLTLLLLGGCASLPYYTQALAGQIELSRKARPVQDVITAPDTPPATIQRLKWATLMRDFASRELYLPDNASYRNYADLQRPYVVWNVVATPEFAFTPKTECFPIAGCLSYQGFFDQPMAQQHAQQLQQQGYDVWLYGVSAYSTLGWIDDPLLNTFTRYSDINMARLIFHELAHQVVYVQDDSAFNEAFATAVELEGTKRWIDAYGTPAQRQQLQQSEQGRELFRGLLANTRQQLETLYAQPLPVEEKRRQKAQQLEALASSYRQLQQESPHTKGYDHWFQPLPNNAHFASLATYHRLVPAFQALLQQAGNEWPRFYQQVKQLAQQPRAEREQQLQALLDSGKRP